MIFITNQFMEEQLALVARQQNLENKTRYERVGAWDNEHD